MNPSDDDIFNLEQFSLAEAWNQQPGLYWKHAKQLADASEEYEREKAAKDLVYAELDNEIRNNPSKYDLGKVTEDVVKQAIIRQRQYQVATSSLIKAKHRVDVLKAYVEALDHRKKALESRAYLAVHDLDAEPRPPKGEEAREKLDHMRKQEIRNRGRVTKKA